MVGLRESFMLTWSEKQQGSNGGGEIDGFFRDLHQYVKLNVGGAAAAPSEKKAFQPDPDQPEMTVGELGSGRLLFRPHHSAAAAAAAAVFPGSGGGLGLDLDLDVQRVAEAVAMVQLEDLRQRMSATGLPAPAPAPAPAAARPRPRRYCCLPHELLRHSFCDGAGRAGSRCFAGH
eukprot:SAG22_NODE_1817_length_3516_cov_34.397425_5_plen_175_part_00